MGFLYHYYQDEELTFRVFVQVIDQLLLEVFVNDLKNIRKYFYKIDRLTSIYLPKLHEHFKINKIEAAHYASLWIITFFSSCFSKGTFPDILYDIWDIILARKWKGFFNIVINIFRFY